MTESVQSIAFDVLLIGAGPASLSCALHLSHLINARTKNGNDDLKGTKIAILEKASEVGDHILSGALFNTDALTELMPDYEQKGAPTMTKVARDRIHILTKSHFAPLPFHPPLMSNRGNYIASLGEITKWLAKLCEKQGVGIFTSEAADKILLNPDGKVRGIVTKDKGLDKENHPRPNFMAGAHVSAKVTVFGEGSKGYLTKKLVQELHLDEGCIPQGYAIGIKELWEVERPAFKPGLVIHTMGYPLGLSTLGGGFIYHYGERNVALGLVTSLDYRNPELDPFEYFQRWKENPLVAKQIKGGERISYGAKCLSEGGYFTLPRPSGDGFLIIGEGAGLLDSIRLKGIPMAIKSGMIAAETIFESLLKNDFSSNALSSYKTRLDKSWIRKDLWRARNFHQGFHKGLIPGMIHTAFQTITGGRGLVKKFSPKKDYLCMRPLQGSGDKDKKPFTPDGKITFDRLTSVYASGTKHEEEQPCHLIIKDPSICIERCTSEYGNPCTRFCPAKVYEIIEDENGKPFLQINPTNCLHCKTCEIKDPYETIEWVPPESGGGPRYEKM